MADGTVQIKTELDNDGFKSGLDKLKSIGSTAFSALTAGILATGAAMGALIGTGVKYNAEIETLQTSFEVMTGSAQKASEITQNLKKLAAATPFELKDLGKTTQLLMQYGLSADDAQARLKNLGDISQGSADKMQRIGMAYGQMSSSGKVMLEDVKQMIEAGFNPLDQISRQTGESMSSLYDRISKGTVTVDEITTAMQNATSQGGMYFESMKKQSETLTGQISTLKDNFGSLAGTLGKGVTDAIRTQALPALNELLTTLETAFTQGGFSAFAQKLGEGLANIVTSISQQAPAFLQAGIDIIDNLIKGILNNKDKIVTALIDLINVMVNGITNLLPKLIDLGLQLLTGLLSGFAKDPSKIVTAITDCLKQIAKSVATNLPLIFDAGIKILMALLDGIGKSYGEIMSVGHEMLIKLVDVIIKNLPLIIKTGLDMILALIQGISNSLPQLIAAIPTIITTIVKVLTDPEMIKQMIYAALQIILALGIGLIKALPELLTVVPKIIAGLLSTFGTFNKVMMSIGMDILKWIWNGVVSLAGWIASNFGNWAGQVYNWIKNGLSNIGEIGKNIVIGIWNGISSMVSWLYNKVTSWASGILSTIMNSLGEKSPSKITALYGKYLAQGLGIGFGDEISNVYKDMSDAIDLENTRLSAALQAGNIYSNIMATTPVQVNGSYTSNVLVDGEVLATTVNRVDTRRNLQYGY